MDTMTLRVASPSGKRGEGYHTAEGIIAPNE
jgi:hypothetical protein